MPGYEHYDKQFMNFLNGLDKLVRKYDNIYVRLLDNSALPFGNYVREDIGVKVIFTVDGVKVYENGVEIIDYSDEILDVILRVKLYVYYALKYKYKLEESIYMQI